MLVGLLVGLCGDVWWDCGAGMWGAFLGLGHHLGWPRELWVSVTVGVAGGPSEILTRLGKIYFQANTTSVRELGCVCLKLGKPRKPRGLQNWATPGRARQSADKTQVFARNFCKENRKFKPPGHSLP